MFRWFMRVLGIDHENGLGDVQRSELERVEARSRRILTASVRMRIDVMKRVAVRTR